MSKYVFLGICLFFTLFHFRGFAAEKETKFTLQYKNKVESKEIVIEQVDKKIVYQGIKLSLATIVQKKKDFQKLYSDSIHTYETENNCSGGFYKYTRNIAGEVSEEKGCIVSHRFGYLYNLFSLE